MRRILPVLILLLAPAAADERKSYTDARFELEKANFDELAADERDRLFEAYGRHDHHEVIQPLAEIIARYGTYMAVLDWKQAAASRASPGSWSGADARRRRSRRP